MTQNTRMKLGVTLGIGEGSLQGRTPTFRDIQAAAQAAERAGFDSLWVADHLIYRFPGQEEKGTWEAFTMLSALAAVTTRITLGSLVACAAVSPPALRAQVGGIPFQVTAVSC